MEQCRKSNGVLTKELSTLMDGLLDNLKELLKFINTNLMKLKRLLILVELVVEKENTAKSK